MMAEWNVGDRVIIRPDECWTQPRRGWAERRREGTVKSILDHGRRKQVSVLFDRTRNKLTGLEYFNPKDLLPAKDQPHD